MVYKLFFDIFTSFIHFRYVVYCNYIQLYCKYKSHFGNMFSIFNYVRHNLHKWWVVELKSIHIWYGINPNIALIDEFAWYLILIFLLNERKGTSSVLTLPNHGVSEVPIIWECSYLKRFLTHFEKKIICKFEEVAKWVEESVIIFRIFSQTPLSILEKFDDTVSLTALSCIALCYNQTTKNFHSNIAHKFKLPYHLKVAPIIFIIY